MKDYNVGDRVRWNHINGEPDRTGRIKDIYQIPTFHERGVLQYRTEYLIAPDDDSKDMLWNGKYPRMTVFFDGNDVLKGML